jgi:hypothetical protein
MQVQNWWFDPSLSQQIMNLSSVVRLMVEKVRYE